MTIRILHIFAPSYKTRFAGPVIQWRYYFSTWNDPKVSHWVLDSEEKKVIDAQSVFKFDLPEKQWSSTRWGRLAWTFSLLRLLSRYSDDFDLIHFHVLWWGSLLTARWAKRHKIPCIYESVLLDSDNPSAIGQERLGKIKVSMLRNFKGILAISEHLAQDYLGHGFTREQVYTLMNSVDVEGFHPCVNLSEKQALRGKYSLPAEATILLFVGSVIERKGADLLVTAFIDASRSKPDLYLLIIGPHNKEENPSLDKEFIDGLQDQLINNNLSERVNFYGLVKDRNRLAEIVRACDLFVFPSRNEGMPTVLLEAMASALPVITSQLPGLERLISDGENGIFVPIGDIHRLRESIITLCNDLQLAQFMGQNSRAYTIKRHGFLTWQSQLVEIYRNLILKK